ncbi:hypothetical protein RIF29_28716 [Crotalaria pallida]|uniref:Uncharacterized protein n=1 Tax=Crotalaria pallida TaxID=3830 RepID=A0AAN9HVL0_CROPI
MTVVLAAAIYSIACWFTTRVVSLVHYQGREGWERVAWEERGVGVVAILWLGGCLWWATTVAWDGGSSGRGKGREGVGWGVGEKGKESKGKTKGGAKGRLRLLAWVRLPVKRLWSEVRCVQVLSKKKNREDGVLQLSSGI